MSSMIHRSFTPDLEVRGGSEGRTVCGIAVPYDTPARIGSGPGAYDEVFVRGAFERTLAERGPQRVKLLAQHDGRALPLGRAEQLREDAAGLYAELRVSKTTAGDEVLELVRDGALDGLSVGFVPVRDARPSPAVIHRLEVKLHEISVVAFPCYVDARVAAVRGLTPARPLLAAARHAHRGLTLTRLESINHAHRNR